MALHRCEVDRLGRRYWSGEECDWHDDVGRPGSLSCIAAEQDSDDSCRQGEHVVQSGSADEPEAPFRFNNGAGALRSGPSR